MTKKEKKTLWVVALAGVGVFAWMKYKQAGGGTMNGTIWRNEGLMPTVPMAGISGPGGRVMRPWRVSEPFANVFKAMPSKPRA